MWPSTCVSSSHSLCSWRSRTLVTPGHWDVKLSLPTHLISLFRPHLSIATSTIFHRELLITIPSLRKVSGLEPKQTHSAQVACHQACIRILSSLPLGLVTEDSQSPMKVRRKLCHLLVHNNHLCLYPSGRHNASYFKMTWNLHYEGTSGLIILPCTLLRAEHLSTTVMQPKSFTQSY